jgi:hypothetical protein
VIHSCCLDQAAAYQRSIDNYRRSGGRDPEVMASLQAQIKKAGLASQIPDGEFVQATLFVDGTVREVGVPEVLRDESRVADRLAQPRRGGMAQRV